jgi:hypothetical protein
MKNFHHNLTILCNSTLTADSSAGSTLVDNGVSHSRISAPKLVNVQEWEAVDYSINNDRSLATLNKPPFGLKMMVTSTFNNLKGSANYHLMIDFG